MTWRNKHLLWTSDEISRQQPFVGRNPTTLVHQILHENPRPLDIVAPNVDPSLVALIKRLMAKHPGARRSHRGRARPRL